jgi:6-phosphofructokinase 1
VETDAGGNRKLPPIGLWLQSRIAAYFKERGTTVHIKYIGEWTAGARADGLDCVLGRCVRESTPCPCPACLPRPSMAGADPSYMIRSVPANPADSILCTLLAQSAVHGVMAGYTGLSVGALPKSGRGRGPVAVATAAYALRGAAAGT